MNKELFAVYQSNPDYHLDLIALFEDETDAFQTAKDLAVTNKRRYDILVFKLPVNKLINYPIGTPVYELRAI